MDLLNKGFIIMILGMGMVFLFLIVLVFVMNFIEFLASKFETDTVPVHKEGQRIDDRVKVAISAAIITHLKQKNNN